jgi:hypothetical protein
MSNGLSGEPPPSLTPEQRGKIILGTALFLMHLPLLVVEIQHRDWRDMSLSGVLLFFFFASATRSNSIALFIIRAVLIVPPLTAGFLFYVDAVGAPSSISDWSSLAPSLVAYAGLVWVFFISPSVRAYLRQMERNEVRAIFARASERRAQRVRKE